MDNSTLLGQAEGLLATVGFEVRVLRQVERRLALQIAPDFSLFDFVRTDEIGLSRCLASILDPAGTHGQGNSYLSLFMEELGCAPQWHEDFRRASVRTEARANGTRRYDIEVKSSEGRSIVIENKPWATDQLLQMADYARQLERTCGPGEWKLVYLSEGAPSEHSIGVDDLQRHVRSSAIHLMDFHQLAAWLDRCVRATKPAAVRLFLDQLEQYVRKNLCGETDMQEAETIKTAVVGSQENLRAALLIGGALEEVKTGLLEDGLERPLRSAWGTHFLWEKEQLLRKGKYGGFGFQPVAEAPGYLRFQFEERGWRGFFWGIKRAHKRGPNMPEHRQTEELLKALDNRFGRGGCTDNWFWYSENLEYLGTPGGEVLPAQWQYSEGPWLAMQRRDLHPGFVALAREVTAAVSKSSAREILEGAAN